MYKNKRPNVSASIFYLSLTMTRSIFTRWLFCTVPIYLYKYMLCVGMIIARWVELYNSIDFSSNKMVPPTRLHLYSSSRTSSSEYMHNDDDGKKYCLEVNAKSKIEMIKGTGNKFTKNALERRQTSYRILPGYSQFSFPWDFSCTHTPDNRKKNNRSMNDDDGWIQHRMNVVRTEWKTPIWWISIYPADWLISSESNFRVVSSFFSTFRFENYFLHEFFAHEWIKRVERRGTHSEQLLIGHHFCFNHT